MLARSITLAFLLGAPVWAAPAEQGAGQTKLLASDGGADDRFGVSVALHGTTAVVGAFLNDDDAEESGSAYVFDLNGQEIARLLAADAAQEDWLGFSVATTGSIALVGAPGPPVFSPTAGAAYIFAREAGGPDRWGQVAKLIADAAPVGARFGAAVALDSDTAVVGAPLEGTRRGAVTSWSAKKCAAVLRRGKYATRRQ